jgi:hypothetical protein
MLSNIGVANKFIHFTALNLARNGVVMSLTRNRPPTTRFYYRPSPTPPLPHTNNSLNISSMKALTNPEIEQDTDSLY